MIKKDSADRLRRFIRSRHHHNAPKVAHRIGGIENEAFQDESDVPSPLKSSNSLEELSSVSKREEGAKKKCVNGLVRSESTNIGGTKKKVRG